MRHVAHELQMFPQPQNLNAQISELIELEKHAPRIQNFVNCAQSIQHLYDTTVREINKCTGDRSVVVPIVPGDDRPEARHLLEGRPELRQPRLSNMYEKQTKTYKTYI